MRALETMAEEAKKLVKDLANEMSKQSKLTSRTEFDSLVNDLNTMTESAKNDYQHFTVLDRDLMTTDLKAQIAAIQNRVYVKDDKQHTIYPGDKLAGIYAKLEFCVRSMYEKLDASKKDDMDAFEKKEIADYAIDIVESHCDKKITGNVMPKDLDDAKKHFDKMKKNAANATEIEKDRIQKIVSKGYVLINTLKPTAKYNSDQYYAEQRRIAEEHKQLEAAAQKNLRSPKYVHNYLADINDLNATLTKSNAKLFTKQSKQFKSFRESVTALAKIYEDHWEDNNWDKTDRPMIDMYNYDEIANAMLEVEKRKAAYDTHCQNHEKSETDEIRALRVLTANKVMRKLELLKQNPQIAKAYYKAKTAAAVTLPDAIPVAFDQTAPAPANSTPGFTPVFKPAAASGLAPIPVGSDETPTPAGSTETPTPGMAVGL